MGFPIGMMPHDSPVQSARHPVPVGRDNSGTVQRRFECRDRERDRFGEVGGLSIELRSLDAVLNTERGVVRTRRRRWALGLPRPSQSAPLMVTVKLNLVISYLCRRETHVDGFAPAGTAGRDRPPPGQNGLSQGVTKARQLPDCSDPAVALAAPQRDDLGVGARFRSR